MFYRVSTWQRQPSTNDHHNGHATADSSKLPTVLIACLKRLYQPMRNIQAVSLQPNNTVGCAGPPQLCLQRAPGMFSHTPDADQPHPEHCEAA